MRRNKSSALFWALLTVANVLALMYPVHILFRAESVEENLFAALVFIGSVFVLMLADAFSIVTYI